MRSLSPRSVYLSQPLHRYVQHLHTLTQLLQLLLATAQLLLQRTQIHLLLPFTPNPVSTSWWMLVLSRRYAFWISSNM